MEIGWGMGDGNWGRGMGGGIVTWELGWVAGGGILYGS